MEQWKDIKGFEGRYQVSDLGRIKALNYNRTGKERVLVGKKLKNGYLAVSLCKDGKVKQYYVHRLVAEAFIPNPDRLPCINHRDEDRSLNVVSNLEWCDVAYNNTYGTHGEHIRMANINQPEKSKTVYQYTLDGVFVRSYPSLREAERQGYNSGNISLCCSGKNKHHKGYLWSYTPLIPKGQLF